MRYAIVIEKAENNYGAYVPDLPGCAATGKTIEATEKEIREALEFHLRGLREDGIPIPEPSSRVDSWKSPLEVLFKSVRPAHQRQGTSYFSPGLVVYSSPRG